MTREEAFNELLEHIMKLNLEKTEWKNRAIEALYDAVILEEKTEYNEGIYDAIEIIKGI